MNFRTIVPIEQSIYKIGYSSKILSIGSCFSVNIAQKLEHHKFQIVINPFGILFHPLVIEKMIRRALENSFFQEENFFQHNDLWHSFDVHSELSQTSLSNAKLIANQKLIELQKALKEADFIFITLGTAWVYEHYQKGIVANCHKLPQTNFSKKLLSTKEIETSLWEISHKIEATNPNAKIIFTISPVRHIKDGFAENQLSKSHLICGLHSFLAKNNLLAKAPYYIESNRSYFPAYEIMIDELRDYRFYTEDMLHPSEIAVQYIWQRFIQTYIDETCLPDMKLIDSIQKSLQHRSFNPESEQFKSFQQNLQEKIRAITHKFKTNGIHLHFEK
ncbi:MAG: GSCFA domain-containing protein [Capnocytophaga sp.]|nr:GSCFA domain-containing protein [Capnocytophaga sp.]